MNPPVHAPSWLPLTCFGRWCGVAHVNIASWPVDIAVPREGREAGEPLY